MLMTRLSGLLLATTVLVALAMPAKAVELIANGSFELHGRVGSNGFFYWDTRARPEGFGTFLIQTGDVSPWTDTHVESPPAGSFAAMTDGTGPTAQVLFQTFNVPAVVTSAILHFEYFVRNLAGAYYTPSDLDSAGGPNQQDRVDIISSTAPIFSTAPADVLATVLRTSVSDPRIIPYTSSTTDLTSLLQAHEGQTLMLRFGVVDNQANYYFGVDSVSLSVNAIPEPAGPAWFAVGLAGLGIFARRRSARTRGAAVSVRGG